MKEQRKKRKEKLPTVSVCVLAYQHRNYIRDCLDGVLMQETNFDFEIILGEDGSTDGTREICVDYANRYDCIKLFLRSREDAIIIGNRPTGRFNFIQNIAASRGKYIAICEGDDYWTAPDKLQKQVDFLENNPDFSMCSHEVETRFEGHVKKANPFTKPIKIASFEDILDRGLFIPSVSMLYRRSSLPELPSWYAKLWAGHLPLILLIALSGKNMHMDQVMALKRKNPGGLTQDKNYLSFLHKNKPKEQIYFFKKLNEFSHFEYNEKISRKISRLYLQQTKIEIGRKNIFAAVKNIFLSMNHKLKPFWTSSKL